MRRSSDKIRLLADEIWAEGKKMLSGELHNVAQKEEQRRKSHAK